MWLDHLTGTPNWITVDGVSENGHQFTLKEAARACDVSAQTIRRRLRDEVFPNASKETLDGVETWQIPLGDLLAAGFSPTSDGRPAKTPPPKAPTAPVAEVIEAVAAASPKVEIVDVDELVELQQLGDGGAVGGAQ